MLRTDLVQKCPAVRILGIETLHKGKFGAVLSRAGVGKTQFLVQIALTRLLEGDKVLHISLNDQLDKINIRYKEGYNNLIDSIGYIDPVKASRLWDDLNPAKAGICYNEVTFAPSKIRDYLNSFKKEDLTMPSMIVMDGLDFDADISGRLEELKEISTTFSVAIWFSMKTHRDEPLSDGGYPRQLEETKDLFDKALFLQPRENKIEAVILKDGERESHTYLLDPATMMIAD